MNSVTRRDLRVIAAARATSFLGDQIALVTLMLRVAAHGPRIMTAVITLCSVVPAAVLSPYAGALVDRMAIRRFLALIGVGNAIAALGLALFHSNVATVILLATLGASAAFTGPGYSALVPSFVPAEDLQKANSLIQTLSAGAMVAGPFAAGLLVAGLGQSWPLVLDAVSFLALAVGTSLLHHDRVPSAAARDKEQRDTWAGVRLLWADQLLRAVCVVIVFFVLALMMVNVAEVFFITQTLHASTFMYGLSGGVFGIGMLSGAALASSLTGNTRAKVLYVFGGAFTISACFVAIALAPSLGYIFAPLVIAGIGNGITESVFPTLFALRSNEAIRGRVFAAVGSIFTLASMISLGVGGVVTSVLSPRGVFLLSGTASGLVILVLAPFALRSAKTTGD